MAITANTLPTFPNCPSYGFTSRPEYLVVITERSGGFEKRTLKWQEPIFYYDGAPFGPRYEPEIYRILNFFHAMRGSHRRFRFKDLADFKSSQGMALEVTGGDQPFVALGGGQYQLVKKYEADMTDDLIRKIVAPIGSSIIVKNNLGVVQVPSKWTIDENTGVLTTNGTFTGTPGGWGGEFYVHARFAAPVEIQVVDKKINSVNCTVKSLRSIDT